MWWSSLKTERLVGGGGQDAMEVSGHCSTSVMFSLLSTAVQETPCHPYLTEMLGRPICSNPVLSQWFGLVWGDLGTVQTGRQDPGATRPSMPF